MSRAMRRVTTVSVNQFTVTSMRGWQDRSCQPFRKPWAS
jgi:hypothetical protein